MFPVPFLNRGIFVDPDAQVYFDAVAATGTALTAAQKDLINPFFVGIKADGLYTKIDGGNILCLTTAAQCYIDWKSPSRVATVYSVPTFTFTANRGFTASGSADTVNLPDSIDTGFNPFSAGGQMVQNSAHIAAYRHQSGGTTSSRVFAGANGSNDVYLTPRSTGDNFTARLNAATDDTYLATVTDGSGFFLASRTGAAEAFGQRNATQGSTITRASVALPNATIRYLQVTGLPAELNIGTISFGCYGGGLTTAQGLLLNTRVQTLVTGLRAL